VFMHLRSAALRLIVRAWLDVPIFASPRVSPRESTQRRKVELWARNVREFCLNANFHVTFSDLLHAVKLRHGTDGFSSSPKEGVLRIFCPENSTVSAGCEPANLYTKGQHATSRPPKPLNWRHDVYAKYFSLPTRHICAADTNGLHWPQRKKPANL
jgi:hypothetical protein